MIVHCGLLQNTCNKMNNFPKVETKRLFLTKLDTNDIPEIVKHASNKKISDVTHNIPFPYFEKDAIFWINSSIDSYKNGTKYTFAIRLKGDNKFIGKIGLSIDKMHSRAEIGYWLGEKYWNNGFMTEATKSIIKFGFKELGLKKFTSTYLRTNPASGIVMKNIGMTKEGELNNFILKNSEYHDLIFFGLTKEDYEEQHSVII